MHVNEAIELIEPAVRGHQGVWADLGAGSGLFSRALASLLDPAGRVVAVDRNAAALRALAASLPGHRRHQAPIDTVLGDFQDASLVADAAGTPLDGILLANALHFAARQERVLADLTALLRQGGRIVVVEYDGRPASRWVPFPVPLARLHSLAAGLPLGAPRLVGQRPSAYGGVMYCAVLE